MSQRKRVARLKSSSGTKPRPESMPVASHYGYDNVQELQRVHPYMYACQRQRTCLPVSHRKVQLDKFRSSPARHARCCSMTVPLCRSNDRISRAIVEDPSHQTSHHVPLPSCDCNTPTAPPAPPPSPSISQSDPPSPLPRASPAPPATHSNLSPPLPTPPAHPTP